MSASPCVAATFPTPTLFGAEFLSLNASLIQGYNGYAPAMWRYDQPTVLVQNVTFCNITTSYTHPGQNDTIYVETWLPTHDTYNGRLQAVGGGGWAAGRFVLSYAGMAGAIVDGYATVTTDAGLGSDISGSWLYLSGDNSNLYDLKNFGSTSLGDEAVIAKQFIKDFYGSAPKYSYWNGCSNGGRQGLSLAQNYPDAYDGIIAAAPAIYWAETNLNTIWGPIYMDMTKQYPNSCELAELTSLAVSLCDARDGVTDGIISEPEDCLNVFDAQTYVGTSFFCSTTNSTLKISAAAANVATALWTGPKSSTGDSFWYGFNIGSDLSTLAPTKCSSNGTCTAASPNYSNELINYYIPSYNVTNTTISLYDFEHVVYKGLRKLFDPYLGNHDTDLSAFKAAGGKLITYHGLADPSISPQGTLHYYNSVKSQDPSIHDFYRYFKVPGLGHCWGGNGGQPTSLFGQLRQWVENSTAPNSSPVTITKPDNSTQDQLICAYPSRAVYACDNRNDTMGTECWRCVERDADVVLQGL
ncbi:tannase and feruloyl esterase, partial [Aureobasidium melanogenum]